MTAGKKLWRNRKERKEWARRLQSEDPGLEVIHPQAAGIDVGNSAHYVAVRPDRDPEPVRWFECFTADLWALLSVEFWIALKPYPKGAPFYNAFSELRPVRESSQVA